MDISWAYSRDLARPVTIYFAPPSTPDLGISRTHQQSDLTEIDSRSADRPDLKETCRRCHGIPQRAPYAFITPEMIPARSNRDFLSCVTAPPNMQQTLPTSDMPNRSSARTRMIPTHVLRGDLDATHPSTRSTLGPAQHMATRLAAAHAGPHMRWQPPGPARKALSEAAIWSESSSRSAPRVRCRQLKDHTSARRPLRSCSNHLGASKGHAAERC